MGVCTKVRDFFRRVFRPQRHADKLRVEDALNEIRQPGWKGPLPKNWSTEPPYGPERLHKQQLGVKKVGGASPAPAPVKAGGRPRGRRDSFELSTVQEEGTGEY